MRVLPLLLLCAAAGAAEVAQFRAEDFGPEWRATRDGAELSAKSVERAIISRRQPIAP